MLALSAGLLWPCLLNRYPYLFWDSYGYFLQGLGYWQLIGGAVHLLPYPAAAAIDQGWVGAGARLLHADPAIRAIPYSLFFWPIVAGVGFWALAMVQAAVCAYLIDVALERLFGLGLRRRLVAWVVLTGASTLPWFASYLMPDIWAGLLILAGAMLAFAWSRLAATQRGTVAVIATLAASFHVSHLLLACCLVGLVAVIARRTAPVVRVAAPALGGLGLMLLGGWVFFGSASIAPQSPPFLLARQIEDGPALAYLHQTCPRGDRPGPWALCPVKDRIWTNAQDFLWSERDSYWAMTGRRAAIRRQELPLIVDAAAAYPWMQLEASARNALRQFTRFGLEDHVVGRGAKVSWTDYDFTFHFDVYAIRAGLNRISAFLYLAWSGALFVILWRAWQDRRMGGLGRPGWFLLIAVVGNAAICGVLSGPNARYQGRVAWLLLLLATVLVQQRAADAPVQASSSSARA